MCHLKIDHFENESLKIDDFGNESLRNRSLQK